MNLQGTWWTTGILEMTHRRTHPKQTQQVFSGNLHAMQTDFFEELDHRISTWELHLKFFNVWFNTSSSAAACTRLDYGQWDIGITYSLSWLPRAEIHLPGTIQNSLQLGKNGRPSRQCLSISISPLSTRFFEPACWPLRLGKFVGWIAPVPSRGEFGHCT